MQTTTTPTTPAPTAASAPRSRQRDPLSERAPWLRLTPEDGWLTLVLLAIMVYTTIASIQSASPSYAPGLDILTLTTLSGLVLGYLVVQQGRLPGGLVHTAAIVLGTLFAFKETADEVLGGDRAALLHHVNAWFNQVVVNKGTSNDNAVFLLFLAILSFLLAYISVWLVLHTRRPWLAALANAIVLLINLNFTTTDRALFFLVLFLLATLLLLVRFTLAENMRQWRLRGLRFSPDLGWDFMQAGAIFAVIVLLMAYLLPAGAANQSLLTSWNSPDNPWQRLQSTVSNFFAGATGQGPGGAGFNFFSNGVTLQGKVVLPKTIILRYTLPNATDDPLQYLMTATYDTYNGTNHWTNQATTSQSYGPNDVEQTSPGVDGTTLKSDTYDMVFAVPQGSHLFTPGSEPKQFNVAADVQLSGAGAVPVEWDSVAAVPGGNHEIAVGYASTATRQQLEQVPYPYSNKLNPAEAASAFPPGLLSEYLPDQQIDPRIQQAAEKAVAGTTNMYDAAEHLETYLHVFKYSTDNPDPPAGQDAVVWFLQQQQGFCTFFASAMALMARSLGMPARIATGFAHGTYDAASEKWVVRGTDAHVWTQIYFGQYGWINFEPTSSFASFSRGSVLPSGASPTATGGAGPRATATPHNALGAGPQDIAPGGNTRTGAGAVLFDAGLGVTLLIILVLVLAFLFATWWRLLYRGLSPITAAFARVARLGRWAGASPGRTQTPDEYAERLGTILPGQRGTLRQLSRLYARERWGGGLEREQAQEIPSLYEQVRRSVVPVIVRRARSLPLAVLRLRPARRSQRRSTW